VVVTHPQCQAAAALDERLGDPDDAGRIFSYQRCAALDAREEFPADICRELDFLGVPRHYVPVAAGGDLRRYDHALQMLRVIARRDLTVAIAHAKTFLGSASVWIGGSPEQRRRLGGEVTGGAVVSWALTEREHGSDLLAGEVTADAVGDGYRLHGEKWLINNATRGHLICVLARTDPQPGPRSLSVLLVDKRALAPGSHRPLAGERLHGIRGADISGIRFVDARVGPDAVVGRVGEGVEIVLKSLQLTRVLCAGLSLGAADHGVGLALEYARSRHRFGHPIADLPQTRRLLGQAFADLLLVEAVTIVAGRAVHALPAELAPVSAATKYLLPTVVQRALATLGEVIGARSLLTDDTFAAGRFQKLSRDHRLVGIFDGSTIVNLHALITQFPFLARARHRDRYDETGLAMATDLDRDLPEFEPDRLTLVPRHGSSLLTALPATIGYVTRAAERGEVPGTLAGHATALAARAESVLREVAGYRPTARDHSMHAFGLAEDFARCLAAAAVLRLFTANRDSVGTGPTASLWRQGLWLEAALTRLREQLDPGTVPDSDVFERLAAAVDAQYADGLTISLLPYPARPWG
jgi:alkylation response protein AidB-like acyl-CoA dehydrogenase